MKAKELQDLDQAALSEKLQASVKQQFKLRMQKALGELNATHELRVVRKDIARIKYFLARKKAG
jgi:large subunit ribosomal protein L29